MSKDVKIKWSHRLIATGQRGADAGMKSFAAWVLRGLADRLDGGRSVRIEYKTTPRVGRRIAADCIERGMDHANRLMGEMAHQQACDNAMRESHAELFEESGREAR